jgi:hypothetical protein
MLIIVLKDFVNEVTLLKNPIAQLQLEAKGKDADKAGQA